MAVLVDLICSRCGAVSTDRWSADEGARHCRGGNWERLWTAAASAALPREADKCVVYVSSKEGGAVQFPPRNDAAVPARLRERGYERMEIAPRQMRAFEKKHNVVHSAMNFDRGSGNEYRG